MPASDEQATPEVRVISLPEFIAHNPSSWFTQAELLFRLEKVRTNDTKLKHLIRALPHSVIEALSPILSDESTDLTYELLKAAVLEKFSPTIAEKIDLLAQPHELGHLKPTELLRKLRDTFGGSIDNAFIKEAFLRRLPPHIQEALEIVSPDTPLDQLAMAANRALERRDSYRTVSAVSVPSSIEVKLDKLSSQLEELSKEFGSMKVRISQLEKRDRGPRSDRSRHRGRSRSHTPHRANHGNPPLYNGLCWYHDQFGTKAHKCQEGCNFSLLPPETSTSTSGNGLQGQ